ncbi:MAG TPA: GYD domain-containing protein [Terracidiphilus sp.]|jgi:uncharacterized protein with GYD domain|nr:GYD domain-containing protein [Terracidiphilus sp.]
MPSYLIQVAYTPETLKALIKKPHDRAAVVGKAIEKLGGKMTGFWLSFGDYDVVGIFDMPDNSSAAAFALAIGAGGGCKSVKTTPLLSMEEGIVTFKKAGGTGYKPVS